MKIQEFFQVDFDQCIIPPSDFEHFITEGVITINKKMKELLSLIKKVAASDVPVLITGPSGSGKELIAEALHRNSCRIPDRLIKLNCAAIPESLMESEFFGYASGAFTGALRTGKKGVVELAQEGTLFLDEIGEMPITLQAKLLRVLQDGKYLQVGGETLHDSNVRIVAATNQDLNKLIEIKNFREDLYFRLSVIPIDIPPLIDRKEDIPYLVLYFLNKYNTKYNEHRKLSLTTMEKLINYDWPGNVRELKNTIERLILISKENIITLEDLNFSKTIQNIKINKISEEYIKKRTKQPSLADMVASYERGIILQAVSQYGSIRKAAIALKTSPSTLSRKLNQ